MEAIGISIAAVNIPTVPAAPTVGQTPATSQPDAVPDDATNGTASDPANFNAQAADQKRLQAVQQMAQDIANVYVVSDQKFTIFKDATGQYITRFTSLRDGKVTYVPEPELFKLGNSSSPAVLKISA